MNNVNSSQFFACTAILLMFWILFETYIFSVSNIVPTISALWNSLFFSENKLTFWLQYDYCLLIWNTCNITLFDQKNNNTFYTNDTKQDKNIFFFIFIVGLCTCKWPIYFLCFLVASIIGLFVLHHFTHCMT